MDAANSPSDVNKHVWFLSKKAERERIIKKAKELKERFPDEYVTIINFLKEDKKR